MPGALGNAAGWSLADAGDVLGLGTLRPFLDLELDLHPLVERLVPFGVDRRVGHETVGAVLACDEPVSLAVVEPLHFSLGHFRTSNSLSRTLLSSRRGPSGIPGHRSHPAGPYKKTTWW